ncbi:hypothetical protein [Aureibacter tunicatorum]|uniref:Uncharacterized protein n=1 Tax=Aureibacter tunicatorum TaxID=866807 RepID=A0AAE3XPF9_9BACT|nr:hypothetical protein [Aureibacter tunicatorum]MDR6239536.1 hypothetical protein [Aureibacter tunicatorum]BDD04013.1 hypothetical protein AUTU_14960 [Aureibacter tunicatorum]
MTPRVLASVMNLYQVFSRYPLDKNMQASPIYGDKVKEWNLSISRKPMQEMNGDELSFLAFKVGYTWGTESDYKHFLPRFLELIASCQEGLIETFMVFQKLEYFDWHSWRKEENEAVNEFIEAFWEQMLNDDLRPFLFEDCFFTFYEILRYPDYLLNAWFESNSSFSLQRFCNLVADNEKLFLENKLSERFDSKYEKKIEASEKILKWARSSMKNKLKSRVNEIKDHDFQVSVYLAIGLLDDE